MNARWKWLLAASAILLLSQGARAAESRSGATATAQLLGGDGKPMGAAELYEGVQGVRLHVKAQGLTPGAHGLHFHSVGDCGHHDHFASAGGHVVGAQDEEHGFDSAHGPHAGDLPNLYAGADGKAEAEFFTSRVSLTKGKTTPLLDENGSAVMIHALADDYKSQPAGAAGDRVACGVIRRTE